MPYVTPSYSWTGPYAYAPPHQPSFRHYQTGPACYPMPRRENETSRRPNFQQSYPESRSAASRPAAAPPRLPILHPPPGRSGTGPTLTWDDPRQEYLPYTRKHGEDTWMGSVGFSDDFVKKSFGEGLQSDGKARMTAAYEPEPLEPLFGSREEHLDRLPAPASAMRHGGVVASSVKGRLPWQAAALSIRDAKTLKIRRA